MRLGELLRRDRERMGLTLAQVAGRIGMSAAKLRRIEDGELITEYEGWDKLATLYGWPRSFARPNCQTDLHHPLGLG